MNCWTITALDYGTITKDELANLLNPLPTQKGRYILTGDIPHLFNSVIYDHYAAFGSFNKLKALAETFEPGWYLTGHDMWVLNRQKFG